MRMVWGQQQGEGMQAVNPGQRQSSSQRGCLIALTSPLRALLPYGVGGPAAPQSCPIHPSLHPWLLLPGSAPELGEAASAALPFASPLRGDASGSCLSPSLPHAAGSPAPAAPELPAPMPAAQGSRGGHRDNRERTVRPFAR